MVTAAGRKVLQKAIFSFWERIPRRKTGELHRHNRLFLALQTRDEATIRAAFREHYAESAERLAQFCQPATSGKSGKKKAHFPTE